MIAYPGIFAAARMLTTKTADKHPQRFGSWPEQELSISTAIMTSVGGNQRRPAKPREIRQLNVTVINPEADQLRHAARPATIGSVAARRLVRIYYRPCLAGATIHPRGSRIARGGAWQRNVVKHDHGRYAGRCGSAMAITPPEINPTPVAILASFR